MKTEDSKTPALRALRALARYQTHGGYSWAAVTNDGELICVTCVRDNYRQVFVATRDKERSGWAVEGLASSGESEETEHCSNCNRVIWEHDAPSMHCDQCEMLSINGVACHETGCPNMGARWDADDGVWVKQRVCLDCGCTVDRDDPCCQGEES